MPRYAFKGGVPVLFAVAFSLTVLNFLAWFGVMGWADFYGALQPTPSSTYAVHFKGGILVYVPPVLGQYIEWGLYAHLFLLALVGGLCVYYAKTGRAVRSR